MSRSKRSSESPPEFFADRCLGKDAPTLLVDRGWVVHLVTEHVPDDAQHVSDPDWRQYGSRRMGFFVVQEYKVVKRWP